MKLDDQDFLETIFKHVSCGGDPLDFCNLNGIAYHEYSSWLTDKAHPERWVKYDQALTLRAEWFVHRVLGELARIGTVDIRQAFDEHGCLKDIQSIPVEVAAVIAGIDVFEEYQGTGKQREYIGRTKKIKFNDKLKALELLGKDFGRFVARSVVDKTVNVTGEIKLKEELLEERLNLFKPRIPNG